MNLHQFRVDGRALVAVALAFAVLPVVETRAAAQTAAETVAPRPNFLFVLTDDLAAEVDGWQGSAILDLACGVALDDIREKLRLDENPVDPTLGRDEQILQALTHPASQLRFTYVGENADELRRGSQ